MTIDEAIKHCEEVAEELRNVDMGELDALYCGDTECIEARKNDCIECAREHEQLAEWLKELRQFKEQEPCEDCVSRQAVTDTVENTIAKYIPIFIGRYEKIPLELALAIKDVPPVVPERKKGKWIVEVWNNREHHTCSACQRVVDYEPCYHFCPYCGSQNLMKGE